MGAIKQLDLTAGSNHTVGFYHLMGAITAGFTKFHTVGFYHTSWQQSHSWISPRHDSNHTAGFYHVIGAFKQLDYTKSWEQSYS